MTATLRSLAAALAVLIATGCTAQAQSAPGAPLGAALATSDALKPIGERSMLRAVPLAQTYALPALPESAADEAGRIARGTQVYRRAQALGVDATTPFATWAAADDIVTLNRGILPGLLDQALPTLEFNGSRLSELGELIAGADSAHITVTSGRLTADETLRIVGRDIVVDFGHAVIEAGPREPVWLIEISDSHDVAVLNATAVSGRNGILVEDSSRIAISGNDIRGLTENGIVVTGDTSTVIVDSNEISELDRSGIMLHGPVTSTLVERNQISDLLGHSNWNAGILLTGRKGDIGADPDAFFLSDGHWVVEEPIYRRLHNPQRNVILDNDIVDGLSSGVYNDGTIANLFLGNRIVGNAKEGVCFDNGATANVFAGNVVSGNGKRWGQPDDVLAFESVLDEGRGDDGTAVAKLPGVSIDNAIYNYVYANEVTDNWGGGIKMVRTAMFNHIGHNVLLDNNLGASETFHFFGIELGSARADVPATDLDFVGSSGNVVFGNEIHGKHYSGIFVANGSVQNELGGNDIRGVQAFEIERPS